MTPTASPNLSPWRETIRRELATSPVTPWQITTRVGDVECTSLTAVLTVAAESHHVGVRLGSPEEEDSGE